MLRVAEQFQDSDVGRQRQGNEDSLFVRAPLFVVADGMGGAQAGEVASDMAVRAFEPGLPDHSPAEALVDIIRDANRRIHERSQTDRRRAGMGTTLTAAYLTPSDEVVVGHVGDSRCYLLRDGDLVRLTRDHSLVGELVARGKLTEEEAETHPQRSVITRALGPEPDVEVDVDAFTARAGDVFLLCSDGLTSMIPERKVKEVLTGDGDLDRRGRELIAAANRAGGRDNITVILFRLEHADGGPRRGALAAAGAGASARESGETAELDAVRADPAGRTAALDVVPPPATAEQQPAARGRATPIERGPDEGLGPRAASHEPSPPRRRRGPHRLLKGLAVLLVVVLPLAAAFWLASRVVYFIGTDPERGRAITIYRGVPYELPGGIELYERFYPSGVTLDAVEPERREIFTNHKLRSRDDAEDLVIQLERGELNP